MSDIQFIVDVSSISEADKKAKAFQRTVESLSVNKLVAGVSTLEKKIAALVKEQDRGAITTKSYNQGLLQAKRAYEQLGVSSQKATAEVRKFANEARKNQQAKQIEATARAREKAAKEAERIARKQEVDERRLNAIKLNSLKMEQDAIAKLARDQEVAAESSAKASRQQATEIDRLRSKYDPIYRASKQYERALEEIEAAYQSGAISSKRYEASLETLNSEFNRFTSGAVPAVNSLYQFGQQSRFAGRNANRFGMYAQQVGYQVGDFLVQVQGGTNALLAFGQQGTQLAGLLPGVTGAVVGIGLALSTAIGAVVMRQYFDRTSDLSSALKSLKQETRDAATETERLARGLNSAAEAVVALRIEQLEEDLSRLSLLEAVLMGFTSIPDDRKRSQLESLKEELALSKQRVAVEQFYESQRAITAAALEADSRNRKAAIEEESRAASVTAQYMADMYAQIGQGVVATRELKEQLLQAYRNGEDLSKLNLEGGINAAANAAMVLATELGISLANAKALMGISGLAGGRGTLGMPEANVDPRAAVQLAEERERLQREAFAESQKGRRSSGGGATQVDPLEQLRQRIKLETELLGKTEAQKEMIRALGVEYKESYGPQVLSTIEVEIQGLLTKQEQMEKLTQLQETMASSATDLFFAAAKGADAFKRALGNMLQTLAQAIAQQAILNAIQTTSAGQGFLGFVGNAATMVGLGAAGAGAGAVVASANGNVFNRGNVMAFASGGVVSQPNFFPMAGGKTGLMGEAGPEAIMPLKRGKDGKLGVASEGGGGSTVVQPVINIDARGAQQGVAEQINAQIAQSLPTIIEATVSATRERSRRGAM